MKEDCDQCLLPNVDKIMRSETPRTECYILNPHPEAVPAEFARDLERQVKRLSDLCYWAETLLCNAEPPKHSTAEEWNQLVTKFRSEVNPTQAA